jgi:hypothetical protein
MSWPEKIAVYTCITGGYDRILPPIDPVPGIDHILFTDRPEMPARGWQVRPLAPAAGADPALANRYHKLLPHAVLPDHDASLYLDANIRIKASLAPLFAEIFAGPEHMAVYVHPSRRTIREECAACLAAGRVRDPEALRAEVAAYLADGFPDAGTLTGNSILIRRHQRPEIRAAMAAWWDLVSRHSGRDQISLPYLRWKRDLAVREIAPHFSLQSPYFQRYPHWSRGGPRARLYIALASRLDRGAPIRLAHELVARSYRVRP